MAHHFQPPTQPTLEDGKYVHPFRTDLPHHISEIHFGVLEEETIHKMSVLPCRRTAGQEKDYSVNDSRMGVCERTAVCRTCGLSQNDCVGHPGHIALELPVFHLGYFTTILRVCRTICKSCSRVLLTPVEKEYYRRRFMAGKLDPLQQVALAKSIQLEAYKFRVCPFCSAGNGVVRRVRPMRLIHEAFSSTSRRDATEEAWDNLHDTLRHAMDYNKDVAAAEVNIQDFLDPERVQRLFRNIPDDEVIFLGMKPGVRPEALVFTALPVTPLPTRPFGPGGSGFGNGIREDEISQQYNDILASCDEMRSDRQATVEPAKMMDRWDQLQFKVARLLDASLPGYPAALKGNMVKSFAQRMKGKHGRFRGNLSGKRVNYSGRSVISPDPNLEIDELAVPLRVAKILTYPQRVFEQNLAAMRKIVLNGPDCHPGACFVIFSKEKKLKDLRFDREAVAAKLDVGDVVQRHCMNGDLVLFNRQPSLHRLSMMCHKARVLPYRTLRFNECCCAPYNADFDGDEMNIHLVQTEEARAEAKSLMSTTKNIITPKNGEPIISCTQDFLTASYMMTSKDTFLDRAQFCQCVSHWLKSGETFDLPIPAILFPVELWTGKQLYSLMTRPLLEQTDKLNFEATAKYYVGRNAKFSCPEDGYISFVNCQLVAGRLDKKILGGGAKEGLFAHLNGGIGSEAAARCMSRIARVTSRWLMNYGFSLGLGDVFPTEALNARRKDILLVAFAECEQLIKDGDSGDLKPSPGMTLAQTLEARINGKLSQVRDECGNEAMSVLTSSNVPLIMALSGGKGSTLNIAQMMACVGQQTVRGKRIPNSFVDRSLPHFPRFAEQPHARGFVANSFFTSLTPTEFFFHTMAGREGLVDTAVKTAETGYIYRRLMKAMEDMSVQYDYTVRNSKRDIVQFRYGEDMLDPVLMEGNNSCPLNLNSTWLGIVNQAAKYDQIELGVQHEYEFLKAAGGGGDAEEGEAGGLSSGSTTSSSSSSSDEEDDRMPDTSTLKKYLSVLQAEALISAELKAMSGSGKVSQRFVEDVTKFWAKKVSELKAARTSIGLKSEEEQKQVVAAKEEGDDVPKEDDMVDQDAAATAEDCEQWVEAMVHLNPKNIRGFMSECQRKVERKVCEPGTPCGALAAQSVGEPSTQMTLRTFHFAGVASMSITQGVPRLVEVINANKAISTPVIRAPLMRPDALSAQVIRSLVERVLLKEVLLELVEVVSPGAAFLRFKLHRRLISDLQLTLTADDCANAILAFAKRPMSPLRLLKASHIQVEGRDGFCVYPYATDKQRMIFNLKMLANVLPEIVVAGIPGIKRVVLDKPQKQPDGLPDRVDLLAEGAELRSVMILQGIDGTKTTTNHVGAIEKVLGIEAARSSIVIEIGKVMGAYSLNIDTRHLFLLADVMTHKGMMLGITRFGIQKMNHSVLTLASFERTTEQLYDAAVFQRSDKCTSVSESIVVGAPVPLGTNSIHVMQQVGGRSGASSKVAAPTPQANTTAGSSSYTGVLRKASGVHRSAPMMARRTGEFHLDL